MGGDRDGAEDVGDGYLLSNRSLCKLELFFYPTILVDRVQHPHYTRSEDAPALAVRQAPSTQPYRQISSNG